MILVFPLAVSGNMYTHIRMYTCVYICVYMCVCIYTHTYVFEGSKGFATIAQAGTLQKPLRNAASTSALGRGQPITWVMPAPAVDDRNPALP